jgi:oligo-1,6-glucosidase
VPAPPDRERWWKEAVVYQIYPRSFYDSNGDGIGDLRGITRKLDYLAGLGVDVLWLCPIHPSPGVDNGYDISDYQAIQPEFGTMADFDELVAETHRRDLRLILDLVVNHTSDQHPWFVESRSSRHGPKRDFYVWADPRGGREPNNWRSWFHLPAWELDQRTGQYYHHLFAKEQPDLNWQNPELRRAVYDLMHWWLRRGIDGFRMDVINFIAKPPGYPDSTADRAHLGERYAHVPGVELYADSPRVHQYLEEMHREVLQHYEVLTVGECHFLDPARGALYAAESRRELCLLFQFDQIFSGGNRAALRLAIESWYAEFRRHGAWTTITLGNHDFPRLVSVFGEDGQHRDASAKLFATLLLTAPGTPFLYQGDEIGMTNVRRERADDYDDVQSLGQYREHIARGMPEAEALARLQQVSRDNARTPLQWSAEADAGFGSAKPWLRANPNYRELNVAANERDPSSILHFYRRLIALRKREPALVYGEFAALSSGDTPYVYSRRLGATEFVVILNWAGEPAALPVDGWFDPLTAELVVSNLAPPALQNTLELAPWQACVYRITR